MPDGDNPQDRASVSYHLNRLQQLAEERDYIVTLNPEREPAPETVIRRMSYAHPVYTSESVSTQAELPRLNGRNRSHFSGAYFANGFHEDGVVSAINALRHFEDDLSGQGHEYPEQRDLRRAG